MSSKSNRYRFAFKEICGDGTCVVFSNRTDVTEEDFGLSRRYWILVECLEITGGVFNNILYSVADLIDEIGYGERL